ATWLVGALGEVAQAISRIAPRGSVRVAKGGHVKLRTLMATLAIVVLSTGVAFADGKIEVKPKEFDPGKTFLVQADWLDGIGCPTSAHIAVPNADFTGVAGTAPYSDAGCPTGDTSDRHNQGLLLVKTGPTNNFPSATAALKDVKGTLVGNHEANNDNGEDKGNGNGDHKDKKGHKGDPDNDKNDQD